MGAQRLDDLEADGPNGVECRERILEDHRDAAAADVPHVGFGECGDVDIAEAQGLRFTSRALRQQPEQRERGHRLARARLADERDDLAPVEKD